MAKTGTVKKATKKALASNQFSFDNEKNLLTLAINAKLDSVKGKFIFDTDATVKVKKEDGKEYTMTIFKDELGNMIKLFKGSLNYEEKVNSVKANNDALVKENTMLKNQVDAMANDIADLKALLEKLVK
nr:MAG TPA: voltage-gated hydrogen channel protein [Caudoviricetes sp.]